MIRCSKCGGEYPTERLFCGKCKERLGVRCSFCGFVNLLDDLYCGMCLSELKLQTGISAGQESEKPLSSGKLSLLEEIQVGVQEDEATTGDHGRISQQEIEGIFQRDKES